MKTYRAVSFVAVFLFITFMMGLAAKAQETILIRNATIVPVVGDTIRDGSLLIQDGKIASDRGR